MGEHNLQFAALVGSRICHDLISPIGAINNGMELLSMSGTAVGPEMELISQSVDAANARIRFFRIAYGAPNDEQFLGRPEITGILRDITQDSRLVLNWHPLEDLSRSEVQLVFLAIQCAEQAMPYGGLLDIQRKNGIWQLELSADRLSLDNDLWAVFSGDGSAATNTGENAPTTLAPAHVQFVLLPMHAKTLQRSVRFQTTETGGTLHV